MCLDGYWTRNWGLKQKLGINKICMGAAVKLQSPWCLSWAVTDRGPGHTDARSWKSAQLKILCNETKEKVILKSKSNIHTFKTNPFGYERMSDVSILTFLKHYFLDKWFCCSLTIIGPSLGEYLLSWCPWEIVFRGAEQTNSKRNRSATVFFPKQVRLNWGLRLKLFVCLTTCWHYSASWTNNALQPFRGAAGSEHSSGRMDGCVSAAYTGADGKHLV